MTSFFLYGSSISLVFYLICLILLCIIFIIFITYSDKIFLSSLFLFSVTLTLGIIKYIKFGLYIDEISYFKDSISSMAYFSELEVEKTKLADSKSLFSTINSQFFEFFGIYPILGMLLNSFLISMLPIINVKIIKSTQLKIKANFVGWFTALMPPYIFFTPWFLRESLVVFFLSLSMLAAYNFFIHKIILSLVLFTVSASGLYFSRGQLFYIVILLFILTLSTMNFSKISNHKKSSLFFLTIPLTFMSYIFLKDRLYFLDKVYLSGLIYGNGKKNLNTYVEFSSPEFNLSLIGFFINLVRSIFGPLFFEWKNLQLIIIGIDGLFYLILFTFILIYIKRSKFEIKYLIVSAIPIAFLVLFSALTLANYGLQMRIRLHLLPFLLPLFILSLNDYINRKVKTNN